MLQPKKTKYRKMHRGVLKGPAIRGASRAFGEYALKTTEHGFISSRQIEAARKAIMRYLKRGGKLWIRIFPDKPYTKKAAEVPMGGGKGSVEMYVAPVKPGRILFELSGVTSEQAKEAFRLASHKLNVKTRTIL